RIFLRRRLSEQTRPKTERHCDDRYRASQRFPAHVTPPRLRLLEVGRPPFYSEGRQETLLKMKGPPTGGPFPTVYAYCRDNTQALRPCVAAYSRRAPGTIVRPGTSTIGRPAP